MSAAASTRTIAQNANVDVIAAPSIVTVVTQADWTLHLCYRNRTDRSAYRRLACLQTGLPACSAASGCSSRRARLTGRALDHHDHVPRHGGAHQGARRLE